MSAVQTYLTFFFTFSKAIDLESGHLFGKNGLWKIEEGRVVDGEVTVILVEDPDCCPLDTVCREKKISKICINAHHHRPSQAHKDHDASLELKNTVQDRVKNKLPSDLR